MKPLPRCALPLVMVLGTILSGCRGGSDRQMVIIKPRVLPVQADTAKGAKDKAPFVKAQVPPHQQIPASAGVDVPVVQPE